MGRIGRRLGQHTRSRQRAIQLRRQADKEEDDLNLDTAFTVVDFEPARQPLGVWPTTVRRSPFDQVWG